MSLYPPPTPFYSGGGGGGRGRKFIHSLHNIKRSEHFCQVPYKTVPLRFCEKTLPMPLRYTYIFIYIHFFKSTLESTKVNSKVAFTAQITHLANTLPRLQSTLPLLEVSRKSRYFRGLLGCPKNRTTPLDHLCCYSLVSQAVYLVNFVFDWLNFVSNMR